MKDIDHVVGHALLGHDHLLAAVDNEVASLIVPAVLAILHTLVLVQALQLAEVAAEHDWHLANVDPGVVLLEDDPLDASLPLACLRAVIEVVLELLLAELDVGVELSGVSEVSHTSLVREHRHHPII